MGESGGRGRGAGRDVAMRQGCESEAISLSLHCLPQRVGEQRRGDGKKRETLAARWARSKVLTWSCRSAASSVVYRHAIHEMFCIIFFVVDHIDIERMWVEGMVVVKMIVGG